MKPDDTSPADRNLSVPSRDAAANVIRRQLDALYSDSTRPSGENTASQQQAPEKPAHVATQPPSNTPAPAPTQQSAATHGASAPQQQAHHAAASQQPDWQRYHSAWQDYYKEYYQRYYAGHVERVIKERAPEPTVTPHAKANDEVTKLQDALRTKVVDSAKKARGSRHFIPVLAAVVVMALFGFLQYNSLLIGTVQAYVSPGAINPQNIIVDPTAATKVGPEPRLIIPKINVDVTTVYNVANTHEAQMAAMEKGVAHFAIPGAESTPGQIGNTVFAGHSSNDIFGAGEFKFVFVQLDKLQPGDTIYVNYQGTRYTYVVTKQQVVKPTDVQALIYPTEKPMLTLITCTPIGTALNRLLVTAEQTSPDPAKAAPAPTANVGNGSGMPGTSPTILERMFGSNG